MPSQCSSEEQRPCARSSIGLVSVWVGFLQSRLRYRFEPLWFVSLLEEQSARPFPV